MAVLRIENSIIDQKSEALANIGYITGAFIVNFLLNFRNKRVILYMQMGLPLLFTALYITETLVKNPLIPSFSLGFINFGNGLAEVLIIKLIVLNSNRAEFFIGMFYFLSYLTEYVLFTRYL